jgi:hypothetical protein
MYDPRKHNYFARLMQFVETHRIAPGKPAISAGLPVYGGHCVLV